MELNRFDTLTRLLATNPSRRQILKGIVSFAVGSFLSQFNISSPVRAYAQGIPDQTFDEYLYLPYANRFCEEATVCGENVGCGDGCKCIESAEGEIRCGRPTCSNDFCTTTADCAHLGEDYFCDTNVAGCCEEDLPIEERRTRCIAPCSTICPEEQRCNGDCCLESQTCANGTCVSSYDCEFDQTSVVKLRQALELLEEGATSADLTTQGCIRLEQVVEQGVVIARYLVVADHKVSIWEKSDNELREEYDDDNDGFYEFRNLTTFGATDDDFERLEMVYSPETQKATARTTITPQGEMTRYVVEEAGANGQWKVVLDYETPRTQETTLGDEQLANYEGDLPDEGYAGCEANPCDPEQLRNRMIQGIEDAANCLPALGKRALDLYMNSYNIQERDITFRCRRISGDTQANIRGWDNPNSPLIITVDPTKYCAVNEETRQWVLYHEVLHAAMPFGHFSPIESLPDEHRKQLDRVYACIAMCYTNKNQATQCMCAQCLGTVTCDPICHSFRADCGATCPCPTAYNEYYSTCMECVVNCPSGVNCFGYSYCDPVGHSPKCPPVTCP